MKPTSAARPMRPLPSMPWGVSPSTRPTAISLTCCRPSPIPDSGATHGATHLQLVQFQVELSGSVLGSPDVGYNWTAGPGLTLANNVPTTGSVTITQENGSQVVFTQPTSTSPTFVCPGDEVAIDQVSTAYCAEPRVQAMLFRNSDGTWTFDRFPKSYESFTFSSSAS